MPFYEFEGKRPSISREAFVHPDAVLIGDVTVASGCYIGAGSVLRGDIGSIKIGAGSNIQENCVLHTFPDKSIIIHSAVHIGHGCILHGCEVCSKVLVGMGSIVSDGVKINSYCLIGAGSLIPADREIPERSMVVGSPARIIKTITQDHIERITYGLAAYQNLAKRSLTSCKEIKKETCV